VIVTVDPGQLAGLAHIEAKRHAPRTHERRVAVALYTALTTTTSIDGAKRALAGFAAPDVQTAAIELLHRLAITVASSAP
jgi:hypothetical protein